MMLEGLFKVPPPVLTRPPRAPERTGTMKTVPELLQEEVPAPKRKMSASERARSSYTAGLITHVLSTMAPGCAEGCASRGGPPSIGPQTEGDISQVGSQESNYETINIFSLLLEGEYSSAFLLTIIFLLCSYILIPKIARKAKLLHARYRVRRSQKLPATANPDYGFPRGLPQKYPEPLTTYSNQGFVGPFEYETRADPRAIEPGVAWTAPTR